MFRKGRVGGAYHVVGEDALDGGVGVAREEERGDAEPRQETREAVEESHGDVGELVRCGVGEYTRRLATGQAWRPERQQKPDS